MFWHQELLSTLQKDPDELKRQLSEATRKLTVLKVNEKKMTRRYETLLEQEQHLRKDNGKLRNESSQMQAAVTQRIGYLQRYKVENRVRTLKTQRKTASCCLIFVLWEVSPLHRSSQMILSPAHCFS